MSDEVTRAKELKITTYAGKDLEEEFQRFLKLYWESQEAEE